MNEREFAYWLQGAFEIAGLEGVTDEHATVIHRHIALVRTLDRYSVLCNHVEAILQVKDVPHRTTLLRSALAAVFVHVIDPQHR